MAGAVVRYGHAAIVWIAGVLLVAALGVLLANRSAVRNLVSDWTRAPAPTDARFEAARPVEIPGPLVGGDSSVSPTPLALQLFGTQVSGRPQDWLAFIGIDGRNPQTYRTGALLPNGAQVASIARDHVVLRRDGQTLRLELASDRRPEPVTKGVAADALDAVGGPPRGALALAATTETVTDAIRPQPRFDAAGQFEGYELHPAGDGALYRQLGLTAGDTLIAVGGVPLADVQQAAEALQSLARGAHLTVTVLRGGQPITLALDGQILVEATAQRRAYADRQLQDR